MTSTKVQQLQLLQQNLQNVQVQKQQIESQLAELDSALEELSTTEIAYKIVGKIMISSSKEKLVKELEEKKDVFNIRIKNFNQQEDKLRQNLEDLQQEVVKELKEQK